MPVKYLTRRAQAKLDFGLWSHNGVKLKNKVNVGYVATNRIDVLHLSPFFLSSPCKKRVCGFVMVGGGGGRGGGGEESGDAGDGDRI